MSGAKYYYMDPNEDIQNAGSTALMCTPRSWTNAMRELATYAHTGDLMGFTIFDIPTRIIGRVLNKYVPASAVDSFIAFLSVIHKIGDFERICNDIWRNGGKSSKINSKDLSLIALPLAQLVITSHADKLPDDKEFANLMTWLVDQNSDQLASYILDIFKNVFMGDIKLIGDDASHRDMVFVMKDIEAIQKSKPEGESQMNIYSSIFKPFFQRWGVDWDSTPDYREGIKIANKKYGEAFRGAKIDGKDALG